MSVGGSGLRYEPDGDEAFDRLRRQAQGLSALHVDVGRSRGFGLGPAAAVEMVDGLVVADDTEALDDQLRALRAREADFTVQRLLDRAERAAGQGDLDNALRLVDEALGLDRTSLSAWLLRGRCLVAAGRFAEAGQAVTVARRNAKDPGGVRLADRLHTECERAELRHFTADLNDLIEGGDLAEATSRILARLQDRPDDPILLHHWCSVLLLAGSVDTARSVAEKALRTVDRTEGVRFEELLRHIAVREGTPRIEDARIALRRGNTRQALALLDRCAAALGDTEQFQALLSYAAGRHADRAPVAVVGRLRRRRAAITPVSDETLQDLVEWLVQEELEAGWTAFQQDDFAEAVRQFEQAGAMDDRSRLIAFLHAAALFRDLMVRFDEQGQKPTLDEAHDLLADAARLAARAVDDPNVGPDCRQLAGSIAESLDTVREVQLQVARAEAFNRCVRRFNELVEHYQRYPIRSLEQRNTARGSFDRLGREVAELRSDGRTEGAEAMRELAQAIGTVLRQLR